LQIKFVVIARASRRNKRRVFKLSLILAFSWHSPNLKKHGLKRPCPLLPTP